MYYKIKNNYATKINGTLKTNKIRNKIMKEDLMFCHLGNGVSVCDRLRKELI
jgi:hypothetical protein